MHLLKKISISLFVICVSFSVYATKPINICLTGRIVENLPSYGQTFLNAVYMAKAKFKLRNVFVKKFYYDDKPLSPMFAYRKMILSKCAAIIGFEYLTDLLLVSKIQTKKQIPIFTSYASTLGFNNLPKNIFIIRPSYHFLANKMINFLNKHYRKINHLLLITEVSRDSMKEYQEAYENIFRKKHIHFNTFEFLENNKHYIKKLKNYLKKKHQYHFIFLLSGAIASAKIVNAIDNRKIIFIGTENYGSSIAKSFYVRLNNKHIHSYFIRNLSYLKNNEMLKKFKKDYQKKYNADPTLLSAYAYDAMQIILKTVKRSGSIRMNNIFSTKYHGISGVSINNRHFTRSNYYAILMLTPKGYKCVK